MADTIKLNIEEKEADKNPRQIRQAGFIPLTIYGKGVESVSAKVDTRTFVNTYKNNKEAVYELVLGKKSYKTTVVTAQKNYATSEYMNIEFKLV